METLIDSLNTFIPLNEEEQRDKETILSALTAARDTNQPIFERPWPAHFTTSAWTLDPSRTQTLMVYHNIYDSWSWIGGHADGCTYLAAVAQRELTEETGVSHSRLLRPDIFSCEVLTVQGHYKHNVYIPSHLHLNITYVFEANPAEKLRIAPDENKGVAWFRLDEVSRVSKEPWMVKHVYQKLIQRTQNSFLNH